MFIPASAATFTGGNLPFDPSFHIGLVSSLGTGVSIGGEIFYPTGVFSLGGEVEQQVTNFELEQDLNILKYGLALRYIFSNDIFFTFHVGVASFYITDALDYTDSYGKKQYFEADTHATASYFAFAPNFRIWDYFLTPKIIINNIKDGGTIAEWDFNIGKKF
jgi:hypothetical protein